MPQGWELGGPGDRLRAGEGTKLFFPGQVSLCPDKPHPHQAETTSSCPWHTGKMEGCSCRTGVAGQGLGCRLGVLQSRP